MHLYQRFNILAYGGGFHDDNFSVNCFEHFPANVKVSNVTSTTTFSKIHNTFVATQEEIKDL